MKPEFGRQKPSFSSLKRVTVKYQEDKKMACFIVPAAEAVIVSVASKLTASNEKEIETVNVELDGENVEAVKKVPFSRKLKWLSTLLWGGYAVVSVFDGS